MDYFTYIIRCIFSIPFFIRDLKNSIWDRFNPFRVVATFASLRLRIHSEPKYVKSLQDLKFEEELKNWEKLLFKLF